MSKTTLSDCISGLFIVRACFLRRLGSSGDAILTGFADGSSISLNESF